MELLNIHATIRKFKNKDVSTEVLESIIYSGTRASTTGNMQWYSIIVSVTNDEIDPLVPLHFNQEAAKTAPVLLTFVADINRFSNWCTLNNAVPGYDNFLSFYTASIDALLVAQNVCIAAENYGLGICYLGTTIYNAKEIIKVLNLPKLTFPVTTVAMGYPDEAPKLADRLPIKSIVHKGKYNHFDNNQMKSFYNYKESLNSSKRFVKENKMETLAQVFTDTRFKKSDNEFYSKKMLDVLKEQGFLF